MRCLDIGSGEKKIDGFISVDKRKDANPDIICEIGKDRLPFDDNFIDVIFAHHSFEHFDNFIGAVEDLARVSKNGAEWIITVPYCTSTEFNLINPYHPNPFFSEYTFRFFDDIYEREQPKWFRLKQHNVTFTYNTSLWGDHTDFEWSILRRKYLNVVKEIKIDLEVIK